MAKIALRRCWGFKPSQLKQLGLARLGGSTYFCLPTACIFFSWLWESLHARALRLSVLGTCRWLLQLHENCYLVGNWSTSDRCLPQKYTQLTLKLSLVLPVANAVASGGTQLRLESRKETCAIPAWSGLVHQNCQARDSVFGFRKWQKYRKPQKHE